jgi:hypothetical protein
MLVAAGIEENQQQNEKFDFITSLYLTKVTMMGRAEGGEYVT